MMGMAARGGRLVHATNSAPSTTSPSTSRYYTGGEQQAMIRGEGHVTAGSCGGEFLMPLYCRPRSKSMGTNGWRPPDCATAQNGQVGWLPSMSGSAAQATSGGISRTPSRDSLVSFDDSVASSDDCGSVVGGQYSSLNTSNSKFRHQMVGQNALGRMSFSSRDDSMLEDARSKLMKLATTDRAPEVAHAAGSNRNCNSHSQPGTPPSMSPSSAHQLHSSSSSSSNGYYTDSIGRHQQQYRHLVGHHSPYQQQQQPTVRKYSEGSQLMRTHLPSHRWRNRAYSMVSSDGASAVTAASAVSGSSDSPVDLSCKRKKFDAGSILSAGLPYARRSAASTSSIGSGNSGLLPSRYPSCQPPHAFPLPPLSSLSSSERLNSSVDEGIDNVEFYDDVASESMSSSSILRSILLQTGRGRSYSMSGCMTSGAGRPKIINRQQQDREFLPSSLSGRVSLQLNRSPSDQHRATPVQPLPEQQQQQQQNSPGLSSMRSPQQQRHQRVVLAKKNQLPVLARVADHLGKIVSLVRAVPCFDEFPSSDRRLLLANACGRLLLLYMAESNTQFAVTPVFGGSSTSTLALDSGSSMLLSALQTDNSSPSLTEDAETSFSEDSMCGQTAARANSFGSGSRPSRGGTRSGNDAEVPTQQFVDGIQNFIRKCQSSGIGPEEYYYMRVIVLFQSGAPINFDALLTREDCCLNSYRN